MSCHWVGLCCGGGGAYGGRGGNLYLYGYVLGDVLVRFSAYLVVIRGYEVWAGGCVGGRQDTDK